MLNKLIMLNEYDRWHKVYLHVAYLIQARPTDGMLKLFDAIYDHETFLLSGILYELP